MALASQHETTEEFFIKVQQGMPNTLKKADTIHIDGIDYVSHMHIADVLRRTVSDHKDISDLEVYELLSVTNFDLPLGIKVYHITRIPEDMTPSQRPRYDIWRKMLGEDKLCALVPFEDREKVLQNLQAMLTKLTTPGMRVLYGDLLKFIESYISNNNIERTDHINDEDEAGEIFGDIISEVEDVLILLRQRLLTYECNCLPCECAG